MAYVTIPWKTKPEGPERERKKEETKPDQVNEGSAPRVIYVPKRSDSIERQPCQDPVQLGEEDHPCPSCGERTPNARTQIAHTEFCIRCTPQPEKPLGIVEYGHKTAGVLVITDAKGFRALKKPANQRR